MKIKKYLSLILCIIISGCIFSNYKTYSNKEKKFSIDFPKKWSISVNDQSDSPVVVAAIKNDSFGTNVNVAYTKLPGLISFNDIVYDNYEMLKKTLNFKELSSDYVNIHSLTGYKLIFLYTINKKTFKAMSYSIMNGTNFYTITCTSTPEGYDLNEKNFNYIIKHFRPKS